VDFPQRRGVVLAMSPGAVEDEEHKVAVVVELRALVEVFAIFQRERVVAP